MAEVNLNGKQSIKFNLHIREKNTYFAKMKVHCD